LFPAQIHDCKAAIRWLRGNAKTYRLDPSRFVVWGSSAGGHLSALLGTSGEVTELEDLSMGYPEMSSRVQGVVDWYGPTDFLTMGGKHNRQTSPESLLMGCPIQDCPDQVAKANPINYISADDPPFFIQHGTVDKAVPFNQSEMLYTALRDAKVPATFVPLEGVGHSDPRFSHTNNVALIEAFIDRILLSSNRVDDR
jgi:acetyl esterase/lipase